MFRTQQTAHREGTSGTYRHEAEVELGALPINNDRHLGRGNELKVGLLVVE